MFRTIGPVSLLPINNEPTKVKVENNPEVGNHTLNAFTQLCEAYD